MVSLGCLVLTWPSSTPLLVIILVFVVVTTLKGHDGFPACQVAPVFAAKLRRILNGVRGGVTVIDGFDGGWGEATREVEVCKGHVTGVLDEDVLGLKVTVGDAHAVEVVESANNLGQVEMNNGGGEYAVVFTVAEDVEIAARAVWDGPGEEVQRVRGAEDLLHVAKGTTCSEFLNSFAELASGSRCRVVLTELRPVWERHLLDPLPVRLSCNNS
jgi:hypothetical protein